MLQREMQDKHEFQQNEIKRLLSELETARAALHEKNNEFHQALEETSKNSSKSHVSKQRECETELLAALLEHATKQATACAAVMTEESIAVQQLRLELKVAQGKVSEEQDAAQELRQQLQQEKAARFEVEQLLDLQRESLMRAFHQRKACEAEVADFLRLLGQGYPELACSGMTG